MKNILDNTEHPLHSKVTQQQGHQLVGSSALQEILPAHSNNIWQWLLKENKLLNETKWQSLQPVISLQ